MSVSLKNVSDKVDAMWNSLNSAGESILISDQILLNETYQLVATGSKNYLLLFGIVAFENWSGGVALPNNQPFLIPIGGHSYSGYVGNQPQANNGDERVWIKVDPDGSVYAASKASKADQAYDNRILSLWGILRYPKTALNTNGILYSVRNIIYYIYALLLQTSDFWRNSHNLQRKEVI